MRITYIIAFIFLLGIAGIVSAEENNCLNCHLEIEEEGGPAHLIAKDIHFQKGLGCVGCHGGDASLEDMDDVRNVRDYKGVPTAKEIPMFCASCHSNSTYMHDHNPSLPTDQLDKYKTSVHGIQLLKKGDTKVANCVSCHAVHIINTAKLPYSSTHPLNIPATCGTCHENTDYMAEYNIEQNIIHSYTESVHGKALLERGDLGAPACNDCHGNHGAAPPGVNSLSAVCGTCHAIEAVLFNDSPHKVAFEDNDFPMCATCHDHHKIETPDDRWIGSSAPSICIECHSADDGTIGIETAEGISANLKKLVVAHDEAKVILDDAKTKGMMTTDAEFLLKDVEQALIQSRTRLHAFNLDSVKSKAEEGIKNAETVKANSASLIDEYYFRRKGLGLATLFFTLLIVGLYIKLRKIEKKQKQNR